jgi:hypothetical protein
MRGSKTKVSWDGSDVSGIRADVKDLVRAPTKTIWRPTFSATEPPKPMTCR